MKRLVWTNKNIKVYHNDKTYLAKNLDYSEQFLGMGETAEEAINNMVSNIKEKNLQVKEDKNV